MIDILHALALVGVLAIMPSLVLGFIRKIKAHLQGRIGAPLLQPFYDLAKLLAKDEVVSSTASWVMRGFAATGCAVTVLVALSVPLLPGLTPVVQLDIFYVIYLFVLLRFLNVLAALDTASPFGGFAASREVTLAILVEPALVLCLAALAVVARTADVEQIFSFDHGRLYYCDALWVLTGCGIYIASLVDLSRMPVDDPTTHLELTMVHEAMLLENSGPNLAIVEWSASLRLVVFLSLAAQCFLHAIPEVWQLPDYLQLAVGLVLIIGLAGVTAFIEGIAVKLRWTKMPDFIAYSVTFGLLSAAFTLGMLK